MLKDTGIPLGNLTSQLFANIYLNELDQFVKHGLRIKYYVRYTDDFVIIADERDYEKIISLIKDFLKNTLKLELHPRKIIIRKLRQGIDFLGYVILPCYRVLRTKTKKRIYKKIIRNIDDLKRSKMTKKSFSQSIQSYLGIFRHL